MLGDLAAERLWADDPVGAARDFRRWLLAHPEDRPAFLQALTADTLTFRACRLGGATVALAVFGETLLLEDPLADLVRPEALAQTGGDGAAPMAGTIVEFHVAEGDLVEQGQLMFVLESMKMQFEITAPRAGTVATVAVVRGQTLRGPETVAVLASCAD